MITIPSGTVTFLFTDIEGSIKLAQQYPASAKEKGAERDTVRQAVGKADLQLLQPLPSMGRIAAAGRRLSATARRVCRPSLAWILNWWTAHAKRIALLLRRSKNSFTVIAANSRRY